jgi:hypothetical protein
VAAQASPAGEEAQRNVAKVMRKRDTCVGLTAAF